MSVRANSIIAILLTAYVLSATPVRAQIVSVLDEHGQRVFINVEPHQTQPALVKTPQNNTNATGTASAKPSTANPLAMGTVQTLGSRRPVGSSGTPALSAARLEELVESTAARHNVDPALVRAVVETESGGNPGAVSRKGAMGLMQLMPQTALELGVKNVFSPQDNLEAGVRYLRTLLERYHGDLDRALAAYNAGAGAVDRAGGVPQYRETREYVRKVTNNYLAGDGGKPGSTPLKGAANVSAAAQTPPHKIYQTRDAEGRILWAND